MFKKIIFKSLTVFFVYTVNAQTVQHTIDYSSNNLGTTCNVFEYLNSPSVGGYKHSSLYGGVLYSNSKIDLQSQDNATKPLESTGTSYAIQYPFKAGYTYSVQVVAYGKDGSSSNVNFPTIWVTLYNSLPSSKTNAPDGCGPVSYTNWGNATNNPIGRFTTSSTSQTFNTSSITLPASQAAPQYLIITAGHDNTSLWNSLNDCYISKVIINETPNTPTFTLSSSAPSISCGATTPVTFTATGSNVPAGATVAYKWNLGANNGWMYNGSVAPATISTTTNQIALTPACGSALSSVSAMATVNGTDYSTNIVSVNITQPNLSITGNSNFCSGSSSYSIANLPCNATVTWSASPSGIVSLQPNGSSVTVTKTGNGQVTLTATINNACNIATVTSRTIAVGTVPPVDIIGMEPSMNFSAGEYVYLHVDEDAIAYNWTIGGGTVIGSSTDKYITAKLDPCRPNQHASNLFNASFVLQNSCGTSIPYQENASVNCDGGETIEYFSSVVVTPNPTKENTSIELSFAQSAENKNITGSEPIIVKLYDVRGAAFVRQWKIDEPKGKELLKIDGIKKGHYVIVISKGRVQQSKHIIID